MYLINKKRPFFLSFFHSSIRLRLANAVRQIERWMNWSRKEDSKDKELVLESQQTKSRNDGDDILNCSNNSNMALPSFLVNIPVFAHHHLLQFFCSFCLRSGCFQAVVQISGYRALVIISGLRIDRLFNFLFGKIRELNRNSVL